MKKNSNPSGGKTALRRRKLTGLEKLILLIPAVAAVAAAAIILFTMDRGSTYSFADSGHQYYGGSSAAIAEGAKVKRLQDGRTQIADGEAGHEILPVYLDHSRTVVLTGDMLYYTPRNGEFKLVRGFSEILYREDGFITVSYDNDSVTPQAGFLYDGGDFYIFLEPMTISYKGYHIDLPALSYAEIVNGGHIMLFNAETKEFFVETLDGAVQAVAPQGAYTISLLGDSMEDKAGERTLLSARPELFEPIV